MEAVEVQEALPERARRVVIADDADVALPQLSDGERRHVRSLFASLDQGDQPLHELIVQRLRGGEPLFLLRVPGADAVRLIARMEPDAIVVEDVVRGSWFVVRPTMLARVYQATVL